MVPNLWLMMEKWKHQALDISWSWCVDGQVLYFYNPSEKWGDLCESFEFNRGSLLGHESV